jgi:hypothetical protein
MPVSFLQLWENMQRLKEDHSSTDTLPMKAIRAGIHIRDDFWNDFINICNQPEELAELLGVRPEQVSGWGHRVRQTLKKVQDADLNGDGEEKPKHTVLPTGGMDFPGGGGVQVNPTEEYIPSEPPEDYIY